MTLIDISPTISPNIAVFPGDTPFTQEVALSFEKGDNLALSSMKTTLHLGSHADSPLHYHPKGESIEKRSLDLYYGPCQVIEVSLSKGERILPAHIKDKKIEAPRILFKTDSFSNPDAWHGDFNSLSPELINDLAQKGVCLLGIDTPSIDPADDKDLHSHNEVYKNNLAVLEGIVLTDVEEGIYQLMAFPLKIQDADAGPVRAVLLKEF